MIIAIGSKNPAKINACHIALKKIKSVFPDKFNGNTDFLTFKAKSSVSDMPLTQNEILNGARNRAFITYQSISKNSPIDFAIGMEGGVYNTSEIENKFDQVILQNWVFAYDGTRGFFGCSAGIPLPTKISSQLFKEKRELAEVIDQASGQNDIRSKNGAFGILTNDLFTRSHAFETATINALIPFFNTKYY